MNQCDGCRRGLPVDNGLHRSPLGLPVMHCTADRYNDKSLYLTVRLAAEGSDWKRDSGETLSQWAERTLKAAARSSARPSNADIEECIKFWRHYAVLNEPAQDDIADEKEAMLERMQAWADAPESAIRSTNYLLETADKYEKDGQPGPLGENCWGWRDIARILREAARA